MGCRKSKIEETPTLEIPMRKPTGKAQASYRWSINSSVSDKMGLLTVDDKSAVERTWNLLRQQGTDEDVGNLLFTIMFEKTPKSKLLFIEAGTFSEPYNLNWETDQRFRHHIRRVINAISDMVDLIYDDELLEEFLKEMAEKHEKIPRLEKHHFELMLECFDEAIRLNMGLALNSVEAKSWRKFLKYLYYELTANMPESGKVD